MAVEKWIIHPGDQRVIDVEGVLSLKIGLVGGQVDVIAHDEPELRVEVRGVTVKDLRIELKAGNLEIDHPQLGWDNFLEVFRNFGSGGPRAEISVAVPRDVPLNLGIVSASALVAGLAQTASISTVSGDVLVDGHTGDLHVNAVSGDVQARNLAGSFAANTVSGDLTASGRITKADIDTVSSATFIDAEGPIDKISLNGVSGGATFRLDDGYPANYVLRSASGRLIIDGVTRGSSGPSSYSGSTGELSGRFVDLKANTVAGDITVLRRGAHAPADTANGGASDTASAGSAASDEGGL